MNKILLIFVLCFVPVYLYGQSTVTIGIGSSISIGNGSDQQAGYRDGTMMNTGTFNSRSIVLDPVATAASNVAQSSFSANWNVSSGANGYKLDVSLTSNFSTFVTGYQNLDVGTVTSFVVNSGISSGTTYYYRLRAYDIDGITGYSNIIVLITAPSAPVVSAATSINETSFIANWSASTGANKYYLDVATTSDFTAGTFVTGYQNLDVGNVTTFTVNTNLTANTTYYYRLRAANAYGISDNSGNITVLTSPAQPVTAAATSLAQTSFTANWNTPAGATKYYLDVSTNSGFTAGTFVTGYSNLDVANVSSYSVATNLSAGTTYYYRVRANNGDGTSTSSNVTTVLTVPPNPVAAAATAITQTSFTANWSATLSATKYYIDVATDNTFATPAGTWTNVDVGNVLTYNINTDITPGTAYYIRIRAYNASGTSGNSGTISTITVPADLVTTPATNATQTSFSANWNPASGVTKYYLDVSTGNTFSSFVTGWNNVDVGNVTTYSVNSNLTAGTEYFYRVRGSNANGTGGNSTITSLTLIPPAPVAASASSINSISFNANWSAALGATKYYIDVATDIGFSSMVAGWTNIDMGNVTSYTVNTGLTAGTTYYYRIRSNNVSGTSGDSGIITVLTAPAVPTATAATNPAATSFSANWNAVAGVSGYYLDVSTNTNFDAGTFVTGYENLDVTNVTTFSVNSSITEGTTYYYRVRSYNAGGTSTSSNKITFLTLPPAPITAAASSITGTSFAANWNTTTGATGYRIDVSTASDFSSFAPGFNNFDAGNVLTTSVTGLTANTTYYYRVRAYNGSGTGSDLSYITVLTAPGKPAIAVPTSIGAAGFNANWSATPGATGYYLDVASDAGFTTIIGAYNLLDVGDVTTFAVTGLTSGATYFYRVKAYSTISPSVNSDGQAVLTLSAGPGATAATAIAATSFTANWGASTAATGYRLDVSSDPAFGVNLGSYDNLDVLNVTSKSVTGLTAGNQYYYRVRAYNGSGTNGNSNTIAVSTIPPAPTEQAATTITTNGFISNWFPSNGASGYRLDVSTVSNFLSFVSGYNDLDVGNVLSYPVTGLTSETPYYYRIRAYNTGGTSGNSNSVNPTTASPIPAAPSPLPASTFIADGTGFTANWSASTGATKYYLDVSTSSGFGAGTFVAGFEDLDVGNVFTYAVPGLTAGTNYYYRIRAFNATGTSGNSLTTSLRTIPDTPIGLTNPTTNINDFTAQWSASAGATGYQLDVSTSSGFGAGTFVSGYQNLDIGNVTTYIVYGLTGATDYYFRVRAYDAGGISASSAASAKITTAADAADVLVADAATNFGETSFQANWTAYTGAGAPVDGYYLDVSTVSNFATFVAGYNSLDVGNVTNYLVNTNLSAGTQYYYRLRGQKGSVPFVFYSNTRSVLTLSASFSANAPASITQNSFTAGWNAQTGAAGYYLDVSTASDFSSFVPGFNNLDVGTALSYSITGLTPGTTHYYRLRARNASGTNNTSVSNNVLLVPANPVSTSAGTVQSTSFSANWDASTGATKYYLDVSTDPAFGSFVAGWNNTDAGFATTYSVNTGLNSGTTYYYRVRAFNGSGTSGNSYTISVTTAPAPPTADNATLINKNNFTANWTGSTGATKYYIDVATTNTFNAGTFVSGYENLDVGNSSSLLVNGLTAGTTYYYRVRAYNSNGTSSNSGIKSALTLPAAPLAAPVTVIGTTSFTAEWSSVTGASKYYLDVSTVSNFATFVPNWNNVDVGNVVSKSVNTDLSAGTLYYFRVRAFNATGLSDNSETISIETAPPAPVATAATSPVETSFRANWNASAGATGYYLTVSTVSDFATTIAGFNSKDVGNVTSYVVTGLTAGTTYYYKVSSYTGSKNSILSNMITVLILPGASTATAASSIAETSFTANWGAATGATGYRLDVSPNSGFTSFVAGFNNLDVSNVTTYSVPGLSAITNYYYRVRAYNGTGTGTNSNTITLLTVPVAPVSAAATSITNIALRANWNAAAGATGYKLDVATTNTFNAGTFVFGFNDLDVSNVTSYNVTGLNGSVTYYYRIRAYNASGTGTSSSTITTVTAADPSDPPVAAAGSALSQTGFDVSWPAVARATGYKLDVATDMAFTSYVTGFTDKDLGNVITFSVTGLTPGITYYYRARSYNAMGTSSNSGVITVATIPPAPVSSAATTPLETSFSANWGASTGATKYYLDVATDNLFTSLVAGYNHKDVGNVTTYSVTTLTGGTTYYYRVSSSNASGTSGDSDPITIITVPAAPVASAVTSVTGTGLTANWALSSGATKYYLDVSTSNVFATFVAGYENKDVGNVNTYSVTGLTANTTYYYRVRSYNLSGTSVNSGTITSVGLPTASAATSKAETSFSANWTTVAGATKYYLDVATASDFSAILPAYNNLDVGDVATYSVTGLTANTSYYYRIRANNATGTSGPSGTITVLTAPVAPVSTAGTSITPTGFTANWNAAVGATGYYLDVATDNAFTSYLTGFENKDVANVTTFNVTGIERGISYFYRLRAYNASAASGNSSVISILAAPAASVATDIMQNSFTANWNTVTGATKYYIDVATDPGFTSFVAGYNNNDIGNVNTLNIPGLIKNTDYYYRLRSFDGTTLSGNSNMIAVRTLPDAPTATAGTFVTQTEFNANWNIPGGSAPGYKLDIAYDIAFTNFVPGYQDLSVGNVLTYRATSLLSGGTYYFRVRALNSWGTTSNSNIITVVLLPGSTVAKEANLITTNSFSANWNTAGGVAGYKIDVALDSVFTNMILDNYDAGNVLNLKVTGLISNTAYYYRVRAYNSTGSGINSNIIFVNTLAEKPVISKIETDAVNYILKQSEMIITDSILVQSPNNTPVQSATIRISGNYTPGEDQLIFTASGGITGLWDNESGTLTLSGASAADGYSTALRGIKYYNSSLQPASFSKNITIRVNNGYYESDALTRNIFIKQGNSAPVISNLETTKLTYLKGITGVRLPLTDSLTTIDTDNYYLSNATVKIISGHIKAEDNIDFTNTGTLIGVFDKESGILTVTGKGTVQNFQSFLRGVSYRNSSGANGTSIRKSFEFVINDGLVNSTAVLRQFEIKAPLETPTNIQGTIISNRLDLTWTDTNTGEGGYIIERSEGTNTQYTELARVDSNVTIYSDVSMVNGKKYFYRLAAYRGTLRSDYSHEVSVIGIVVGISDQNGIPKEYIISQNYPNPFNPATSIIYGLPYESKVKIEIYNSIGQLVEQITDETKAPGYHKIIWNANGLASGIYIYRISAVSIDRKNSFRDTKRMILVK